MQIDSACKIAIHPHPHHYQYGIKLLYLAFEVLMISDSGIACVTTLIVKTNLKLTFKEVLLLFFLWNILRSDDKIIIYVGCVCQEI